MRDTTSKVLLGVWVVSALVGVVGLVIPSQTLFACGLAVGILVSAIFVEVNQ